VFDPAEVMQGGATTVEKTGTEAFSLPSANLTSTRLLAFNVGNSFFRNPWVIAPSSTTARDGLGPLFNTNTCQGCHIKDGRGHPPLGDASNAVSMLVRLSIPAQPDNVQHSEHLLHDGVVPEPVYGGQLQDMANPGIAAEGRIRIVWEPRALQFSDGTAIELIKPVLQITDLAYGDLHPDTLFSARIAPPMIGLGLLEAISDEDLLAHEDPDDKNADGISGRANRVWNKETQGTVMGRFGWKAGQPSLVQQDAGAFAGDMGLTSRLAHSDDCTPAQTGCVQAPNGGDKEVSDNILDSVLFYSRNLAVPARRHANSPDVLRGKKLFNDAGCAACHIPSFTTRPDAAEPELANQRIFPYTDLLLHDMGEGLADHRPDFLASGNEWRTPPLWGIGLTQDVNGHTRFLHDGRARNVMEAVLWHGGEAETAQKNVLAMKKADRDALLAFLDSL
jgi:CxxC motif-containing protein (DUF1111 family)